MEPVDGKPTITAKVSHLVATVRVPGGDADKVRHRDGAKAGCVVSRALNVKISLDATIEV